MLCYYQAIHNVAACAGKGCPIRPECRRKQFCAGKGYYSRRGMVSGNVLRGYQPPNPPETKKCSRLRGKRVPNPPGMPEETVLRGNGVSFWAQKEKIYSSCLNPILLRFL